MKRFLLLPLLGALAVAGSASAAPVAFNLDGQIAGTGTVWDGTQLTGSISYDDSVVGSMPTPLSSPNVTVSITVAGQTFTQDDDLDAGVFGIVTVVPAAFTSSSQDEFALTLIVGETGGANPVAIDAPEFSRIEINLAPTPLGQSSYTVDVDATIANVASIESAIAMPAGAPVITWTLLNGLGAASQAAVEVHRLDPATFIWQKIADVAAGTLSYTDSAAGTGALYRIESSSQ